MATLPNTVWYVILVVGVGISVLAVYRLSRPAGEWGRRVRTRLVLGIPWGTIAVMIVIWGFYLFAQDGLSNPRNPVVLPFRAWSYFYPMGILTAGIAHAGLNHVTGNLMGALVFGSLAEFAWSHFPRRRGSSTFASVRTNPFVRIGMFAGVTLLVSVFTAAFGLGPVIGFSGVVFAFVGVALVRFPLATIVATVFSSVVRLLFDALRSPEFAITVGETTVGRPWWAGVAIQGHAIGLFVGVVLGLLLCYRRNRRVSPGLVWLAALVFAVDRGLWAIYLIEGSGEYRLLRALGVVAVFAVAAVIALGAVATTRTLVARIDLSRREAAFMLLVSILLALALVAVPFNLFTVDDPTAGIDETEAVEIEDYTVFYAEDVPNQYVPAIPFPEAGETDGQVNASGVIVVSEERRIWWEVISATELQVEGSRTVRLGGVGWAETVRANRTTWMVTGGNTTYDVRLGIVDPGPVVYRAEPATADVAIDGRGLAVAPTDEGFEIQVTREDDPIARTPIPGKNETVVAGGLEFEREESVLVASRGNTSVRVAQVEA